MAAYKARLKAFEDTLNNERIDLKTLRKLCFNGCPFEHGYRSTCWKILLNYLPLDVSQWKEILEKQRNLYTHFVHEMIVEPGTKASAGSQADDHPLNPNPDSNWGAFFKDNDMLLQIDKDCRRLCPDLFFFQKATEYPCKEIIHADSRVETLRKRVEHCVLHSETLKVDRFGKSNMIASRRKTSEEYSLLPDGQEAHWEVVERILFIYAKLNPGQGYVQGMNEILGPIYYTFASDPRNEWKEFAEADSFFCFTNLMAEIRDIFIKTLDLDAVCGIGSMMASFTSKLKEKDEFLYNRIKELDLKPQYYAFRWLTLLLSQEFPLPDVLRIWDSLFADDKRFDFLICICCAMLMILRDEIINEDFPTVMKLVQNFQTSKVDLQRVLSKAVDIR
ncbi:TBC1 domain family member 13-like [Crassostrea angulata]|uniref:TBC1 domain family member 13-like n=1 Tax=Magallana angulata TaxID=2784310 RepID=UPI0005C36772|nr:TBC1 domain family member 13-like [Crassostrea angulata]|eukprot:XP_019921188.1 PREDICTED: TBC1 domain family member 13-like [Crassostrea gigas]